MSRKRNREKSSPRKTQLGIGAQIDHYKQGYIPERILKAGDVSKRIPIYLSDGRTIVYMTKGKNESEIRKFWEEVIHRIQ